MKKGHAVKMSNRLWAPKRVEAGSYQWQPRHPRSLRLPNLLRLLKSIKQNEQASVTLPCLKAQWRIYIYIYNILIYIYIYIIYYIILQVSSRLQLVIKYLRAAPPVAGPHSRCRGLPACWFACCLTGCWLDADVLLISRRNYDTFGPWCELSERGQLPPFLTTCWPPNLNFGTSGAPFWEPRAPFLGPGGAMSGQGGFWWVLGSH